ncbi:hypothetical protein BHM03_00035632 [Ensete ventricosum]|nr:hypothetical protein BHM03_00035632 [Ensete ventricosum]
MHSTPFLLRCASPPLRLLLHHLRLGCSPGIAWFPRPIPCPCIHWASDWTRKNRNIDPGIGNRLVKAEEEGAGGVEQQAGGGAKEEEKGEQRHGHPKKLMTDGKVGEIRQNKHACCNIDNMVSLQYGTDPHCNIITHCPFPILAGLKGTPPTLYTMRSSPFQIVSLASLLLEELFSLLGLYPNGH